MAEGKLDLPDDIMSSRSSDQSRTSQVSVDASGGNDGDKLLLGYLDEPKDQSASESIIPLSPQWLYAKPSETKMDSRAPTPFFLENSVDSNQKEGWRPDGSEEKKDWRRITIDNEISRRWREEERETGLLGVRRDRKKSDRRSDNVPIRDTTESRSIPTSDRRHDGRNAGHETRRDNKWSSRWGPEDKDKDSWTEKRLDADKDDNHNDGQLAGSMRSTSEREYEFRDKWRPRHRMEIHSSSNSASHRAAPGFGLERGRVEGLSVGFTIGRGRANIIGRSSAGLIGAPHLDNCEHSLRKLKDSTPIFCYPRGKILDIYRSQKLNASFAAVPDEMEDSDAITRSGVIEPLAFIAPSDVEEAALSDIWEGKINSRGVVNDSYQKDKSREHVIDDGCVDSIEGNSGILPSSLTTENITGDSVIINEEKKVLPSTLWEETADSLREVANGYAYNATDKNTTWNHGLFRNLMSGESNIGHEDQLKAPVAWLDSDDLVSMSTKGSVVQNVLEIGGSIQSASQTIGRDSGQMENSGFKYYSVNDNEVKNSLGINQNLPDGSSSLFLVPSLDQNQFSSSNAENVGKSTPPEELSLFYLDPHGIIQGPFIGADIILWHEEGFFGTDLPVRFYEAPEETPFQSLGEVMPHLKDSTRSSNVAASNSILEQTDSPSRNMEDSFASLPILETSDLCAELSQPSAEISKFSQIIPLRIFEPEDPLQVPHAKGQNFHDYIVQDGGRAGNTEYPVLRTSGGVSVGNLSSQPISNQIAEPGLADQNNSRMHPFGLMWSELESTSSKHVKPSNIPSNAGRVAPLGAMPEPSPSTEVWFDAYRKNSYFNNLCQDTSSGHLGRMEKESNSFGIPDQLISHQYHQQLNLSSPHVNESAIDHAQQNCIQQRLLSEHSSTDLDRRLAIQLRQQQQQQQHQQLQLQHLLEQQQFQQQQKFWKGEQQKFLQEQQQSQVRQLLLEQLHGQMRDPGPGQSHFNQHGANNVLDQVILEQQRVHDLQQWSQRNLRHSNTSFEHSIYSKFGQMQQQDHHRDLSELISRAQLGKMQSMEQQMLQQEQMLPQEQRLQQEQMLQQELRLQQEQMLQQDQMLQQEQMQARYLSMGLRQTTLEDESRVASIWPGEEPGQQFYRSHPAPHRVSSETFDLYQKQRSSHDEQLNHLERKLSYQDQIFQSGSFPYERSMTLPSGPPEINLDAVNSLVRPRGLDILDSSVPSGVQYVNSLVRPHDHSVVPNHFQVSHFDGIESQWSESNEQVHLNSELLKRESKSNMTSEDPVLWMSDGLNDEKSKRLLMDLLNKKSVQPPELFNVGKGVSDNRVSAGFFYGSGTVDHPFNPNSDKEAGLSSSFHVGSYGSNTCEPLQAHQQCSLGGKEKVPYRTIPGACIDEDSIGVKTGDIIYAHSNPVSKLSVNKELVDAGGRSRVSLKNQTFDVPERMLEHGMLAAADHGGVVNNVLSMHSSLGYTGFSNSMGMVNSLPEEIAKDQENMLSKDTILLRRPPVSRAMSSHEGLSELVSDFVRGKSMSNGPADANGAGAGARSSQSTDVAVMSGKKETRFRRASSESDADVSEASFMDMLKKTAAPEPHSAGSIPEPTDGSQGGGGKNKGKKGRQIDPALLGFKVTSNRIMMGEIQRAED